MKILIIDTQGELISDAYRAMLPGILLRGIEAPSTRGTPCHPHGSFCGWLCGIPIIGAGVQDVELIFVRIFDQNANAIEEAHQLILDAIEEEVPDYISCSWGAWDGDNPLTEQTMPELFADLLPEYTRLKEEIGFVDFWAAGNDDANDADNDIDFPQRKIPGAFIVGAAAKSGVPMVWSGDGYGVSCVMWGDRVYSPDQAGRWTLWSGTSAATPKLCGAAAARIWSASQLNDALVKLDPTCRPSGQWELPHPKWGFGNAELYWQKFAQLVPPGLLPPTHRLTKQAIDPIEYFDFRKREA